MLRHKGLQLADRLDMTQKLELGRRRDQIVDDDVSVGSSRYQLSCSFSCEDHACHGTLVEGELVSKLKPRRRKFVLDLLFAQANL